MLEMVDAPVHARGFMHILFPKQGSHSLKITSKDTPLMDAAWAQVIVSGLVGFTQCGLITVGLWQMRISSNERNRQLDRQDKVMEQQGKA